MQILIKLVLAGIWMGLVPAVSGVIWVKRKKDYTFGESFLAGIIFMFALAEILILPAIYRKLSLHFVTTVFAVIMGAAAVYGLWELRKDAKAHIRRIRRELPQVSFWMWIAATAILVQILIAVVYAHMDADDSFYVATATTSVQTDSVFQFNPYSGVEYKILPKRYVLSPFPILLAVLSRLCGGLHPAVMAHTVYPVAFFTAAYLVYHQFGKMWFPEKKREQGIFLLFCAVLIWFSGFSVYTAGNFQLVRIWQGKAILASLILPFLMYLGFEIMLKKKTGIFAGTGISDKYGSLPCFLDGDYACTGRSGSVYASCAVEAEKYSLYRSYFFICASLPGSGNGLSDALTEGK